MDLDAHLTLLAGATSRSLAADAGISDQELRRAVRDGRLRRVRRGAYVRGGPGSPELMHALAAVAVVRSRGGGALSHHSALAAWGIPVIGSLGLARFHVWLDGEPGAETRSSGLIVRHGCLPTRPLPDHPDVAAVAPAYAVVQVARREPVTGIAAADRALHAGLCTRDDLMLAASSLAGRSPGRIPHVIDLADPRAEAPGESVLRWMLREAGVLAVPQVRLDDEDGFVARVDLLDEETRTVYEFDGLAKYATASDLVAEKRREDRIRRLGYAVERVIWRQLHPVSIASLARRHAVRRGAA